MEADYHVKLGEVFRPLCELQHSEIFQILVINDNIDWGCRSFEVVSLALECFINCQQLFVMNVIVQLSAGKGPRVESDSMKFTIHGVHGKNGHESIIQSVGFHNQRLVRNSV